MGDVPNNHPRTAPPIVVSTISELVSRARMLTSSGERRMLGITGAPGAGKSTLSAVLLDHLGDAAVLIGMDGFHLANTELVRLGRRERKGAPDTFDIDGYVALLRRIRHQREGTIYAPMFDRGLEESIGSAVPVRAGTQLVITEGNYLLLARDGWEQVRPELDEMWFLDIDPGLRRQRLIDRRLSYGESPEEAAFWVNTVDEANAELVESTRSCADVVVQLTHDPE